MNGWSTSKYQLKNRDIPCHQHNVKQTDNRNKGRIFKQADKLTDQGGDYRPQCLGQNDISIALQEGKSDRAGSLKLILGYGEDARPDFLSDKGCEELQGYLFSHPESAQNTRQLMQQIKKIRSWAHNRAVFASKTKEY